MNLFPVMLVGGVAAAGLVAYVAYRVGDARRRRTAGGRPTLRSIPEGLTRAKRARRRVLVAFVDPSEEPSKLLLEHIIRAPELDEALRHFELVRIDASAEDRQVVGHLAAKYGLASLSVPSLLALESGKGEKVGALEGSNATPDKVGAFVAMVRPGG